MQLVFSRAKKKKLVTIIARTLCPEDKSDIRAFWCNPHLLSDAFQNLTREDGDLCL